MCWIAVQFSDTSLPEETLRAAHSNNDDGCGVAWSIGHKLEIRKPLWAFEDILSAYNEGLNDPARVGPLLIHFRLSTGGCIDALNTHPHIVCKGEVVVAHNGVLPVGSTRNCSDTVVWCQTVLHRRTREEIMDKRFLRHQANWIGHNKIVLLDRFGTVRILRHDLGVRAGRDWYSGPLPVKRPEPSQFVGYNQYWTHSTDTSKKRIWPLTGAKESEQDIERRFSWMHHVENQVKDAYDRPID